MTVYGFIIFERYGDYKELRLFNFEYDMYKNLYIEIKTGINYMLENKYFNEDYLEYVKKNNINIKMIENFDDLNRDNSKTEFKKLELIYNILDDISMDIVRGCLTYKIFKCELE